MTKTASLLSQQRFLITPNGIINRLLEFCISEVICIICLTIAAFKGLTEALLYPGKKLLTNGNLNYREFEKRVRGMDN